MIKKKTVHLQFSCDLDSIKSSLNTKCQEMETLKKNLVDNVSTLLNSVTFTIKYNNFAANFRMRNCRMKFQRRKEESELLKPRYTVCTARVIIKYQIEWKNISSRCILLKVFKRKIYIVILIFIYFPHVE